MNKIRAALLNRRIDRLYLRTAELMGKIGCAYVNIQGCSMYGGYHNNTKILVYFGDKK